MKEPNRDLAYDLRDLNDEQRNKILEWLKKNDKGWERAELKPDVLHISKNFNGWYQSGIEWFKDNYNQQIVNALTLFEPTLQVGDTFEHEGFICRVEKPIIIMPKFVSSQNGIKRIKNEHQYKALKNSGWIDVTDTEFIKQLEKHSK